MRTTMAAFVAGYGESGLTVAGRHVDLPAPHTDQVLVRVHAAALTPGELTWRDRGPVIPSHELSGTVAALGPEATGLSLGDEVFGLVPFDADGAAAEYALAPVASLAPKPRTVDHVEAASLPLSALTAWQALRDHGRMRPGEHVLVHGGVGGVGGYAVQLAALWGATVSATASAATAGQAKALGAQQVVDYTTPFEYHLEDVDLVVDTAGGDTLRRSLPILRPGARLVSVVAAPELDLAARPDVSCTFFVVRPDRAALEQIATLVDEGRLRPRVGKQVPFADAAQAIKALSWQRIHGKAVIEVR